MIIGLAPTAAMAATQDPVAALIADARAHPDTARQTAQRLYAAQLASANPGRESQRWATDLWTKIGWTYLDQDNLPAAEIAFTRAVKAARGGGDGVAIRAARWKLAMAHRRAGLTHQALREQQALAAEWAKAGAKGSGYEDEGDTVGYVYEELGELHLALAGSEPKGGHIAAARRYFALAHQGLAANRVIAANEPERLERLQKLSTGA